MGERQRLGVQDALWLEMDRPTNLMVVDTLVWTATPIDWERFRAVVRERLWDRYPAFRSIPVQAVDGAWYWEAHPGDPFDTHLEHLTLPKPGGDAELQELIALAADGPARSREPLWQVICVDGFKTGSAIVFRSHHAIADGIRMVQIAMSLFDATPDGGAILAAPVQLHAAAPRPPGQAVRQQLLDGASALAKELAELRPR